MKNFAARELAIIGSIDGAMVKETKPEQVALLRAMKEAHQEAHAQVAALARAEHRRPQRGWPLASMVMELEGWIARSAGTDFNLDVLRGLEVRFETAYAEARDRADGLRRDVFELLARRCAQRVHVLSHRGPHTCMRCLLDRRGSRSALVREHPHIYICAACHHEVHASFPPDIAMQLDASPATLREAHIIERALSYPSKQRARDEVHTVLAGQPPIVHDRVHRPRPEEPTLIGGPVEGMRTQLVVPDATSEDEQAYTRKLFDYRSMRSRW